MADSYEQLLARLVDVKDPVLPPGKPLREMSAEDKRKNTLILATVGVILLAGGAYLFNDGSKVWASIVGVLGGLVIAAAFSGKVRVSSCAFCGNTMPVANEEGREPLQCDRCLDYSSYDGKLLTPLDPSTVAESPTFEVPLFKDARWPKACVACGEPPTRLDDTKGRTLNAASLVLARVAVSSAEATGIPYCEKHKDAVAVKVGQDRKVTVRFTSIRMMRRYVAANKTPRPRTA